jgi:thymidylate synthase (FAD)
MKLLDHGYLYLIESWGSDERIIEAARMSTGKGFLGWGPRCNCEPNPADIFPALDLGGLRCSRCGADTKSGDEKLLRYLYENKHHTPFEMAGVTIEVQAPIFVFREWHRHRTQSYNEMSARYTPLPNLNYIPTMDRLLNRDRGQADHPQNKQAASTGVELTEAYALRFQTQLAKIYAEQEELYQNALAVGVPKELARVHLPVGRYSRMRASANLRNWLGFMTLRSDSRAQWEIRQYSLALSGLLSEKFPRTMTLFNEAKPWIPPAPRP